MTARDKYLRKTYGITEAIFHKMEAVHNGRCWVCDGRPKPGRHLCVDHDHKDGRVRGLLCFRCNKFLIGRHRTPRLLEAGARYLASTIDWRNVNV